MVVSKINQKEGFHIFLSHAKKDQKKIAYKFYKELITRGLRVYYSGADLYIGDSLEESIENGLKRSIIGIPLLTKIYFKRKWTMDEYRAMIPLKHAEKLKILPVRYKISQKEILEESSLLADTFTLCIDKDIPKVVDQIIEVLQKEEDLSVEKKVVEKEKPQTFLRIISTLLPLFILTGALVYMGMINTKAEVQAKIDAKKITFELAEGAKAIRAFPINSMTLSHSEIKLFDQNDQESNRDNLIYDYIKLEGQKALRLKELYLPAHTIVSLYQDASYLYLTAKISKSPNTNQKDQKIWGIVGKQGEKGKIYAQPINQLSQKNEVLNSSKISAEFDRELYFEADGKLDIVLKVNSQKLKGQRVFEQLSGKSINFTDIDLTHPYRPIESTLQSAEILISGTSLLGQSFPLVDQRLETSNFLQPDRTDIYFIQESTLKTDGISYQLYHPAAQSLKAGSKAEHMHSIFPTLLDVLVGEPTKKTIFGIIAFIVTQFLLLKGYIFPPKKEKETVLKVEVL